MSSLGERFRQGEEAALRECYDEVGPLVRAYVRRFVPPSDVDDVVQTTFVELWRSRRRYEPHRSLEAFVLGIARHRAIDFLRRRRHEVVEVSQLRHLIGDDGGELVDRLVSAIEIRRALGELPVEQRESIELSYFAHRTQAEIADQLDVPIGTVKARMARGMKRLGSLITGGCEE